MEIVDHSIEDKEGVIGLVRKVLGELGFEFDKKLDSDLLDIENRYVKFFVLKENNRVVGCAGINKISSEIAELRRLYIHSEFRGKGFGRKLIEVVIQFCNSEGFEKIVLDTTKRNSMAIKLFEKIGFKKTEKIEDKLFYCKSLKNK